MKSSTGRIFALIDPLLAIYIYIERSDQIRSDEIHQLDTAEGLVVGAVIAAPQSGYTPELAGWIPLLWDYWHLDCFTVAAASAAGKKVQQQEKQESK
ncbi:hypothetical protein OPV22_024450 [Ensete ventricosum]|uniref:Uncharacterized protein n=1 Tax=Ensete ventricosum TaxID=4639 RepID=A0AAV8Q529_ENSVE|nr:hypothetical protein OPV22_024450 [Ensete ventricosum]